MTSRLLLLAGTREARQLAGALAGDRCWDVIASLAGVTDAPASLGVETRTGGFGGVGGLTDYLGAHHIDAVVDATHPFASRMSHNAAAACGALGLPLLRIERPAWAPPPGARWTCLSTLDEAADTLPAGARAFLTVGANSLAPFARREDVWFLVRTIEEPATALPLSQSAIVVGPPARAVEDEIRLMRTHAITHLVTKNAGGPAIAKLQAAARLEIPAIVIARPKLPATETAVDTTAALAWLKAVQLQR